MSFCITRKTGGILRDESSVLYWRDGVVSFDRMGSSFLYRSKTGGILCVDNTVLYWRDGSIKYIGIGYRFDATVYLHRDCKQGVDEMWFFALHCVGFLDLCNTNRYFLEEKRGGIILTPTILLRLRSH